MENAADTSRQTAVLECIFTNIKDLVGGLMYGRAVIRYLDLFIEAALLGLEESIKCDNMEALDYFLRFRYPL